jgi:hypothetical protein
MNRKIDVAVTRAFLAVIESGYALSASPLRTGARSVKPPSSDGKFAKEAILRDLQAITLDCYAYR